MRETTTCTRSTASGRIHAEIVKRAGWSEAPRFTAARAPSNQRAPPRTPCRSSVGRVPTAAARARVTASTASPSRA